MKSVTCAILALAAAVVCPRAGAEPGRIVASNDEWTLSNSGFTNGPDTAVFARNVGRYFVGDRSGNFLVHSSNFGLAESSLRTTMINAGHSWTINAQIPFTLAALSPYDAVFVQVGDVNTQSAPVLISYVSAGGSVYICAGSGAVTSANAFLSPFGLAFNSSYDTPDYSLLPINSTHPLFEGVGHLLIYTGNSLYDLDAANDCNIVAAPYTSKWLFGIYDGGSTPCPADFNQDGGIDGADVDAFFAAWESGDPSADVNQDGGVDGADVSVFFAAWEAGGCG
ncbi:MAG: hypothetical protein JSR77_04475 [Planctomycetes bacterium]|nr:hypothetical protein [Planctomycetota bacterium]